MEYNQRRVQPPPPWSAKSIALPLEKFSEYATESNFRIQVVGTCDGGDVKEIGGEGKGGSQLTCFYLWSSLVYGNNWKHWDLFCILLWAGIIWRRNMIYRCIGLYQSLYYIHDTLTYLFLWKILKNSDVHSPLCPNHIFTTYHFFRFNSNKLI